MVFHGPLSYRRNPLSDAVSGSESFKWHCSLFVRSGPRDPGNLHKTSISGTKKVRFRCTDPRDNRTKRYFVKWNEAFNSRFLLQRNPIIPMTVTPVVLVWQLSIAHSTLLLCQGCLSHPSSFSQSSCTRPPATLSHSETFGPHSARSGFMTKKGGNERFQECRSRVNIQHLLPVHESFLQ